MKPYIAGIIFAIAIILTTLFKACDAQRFNPIIEHSELKQIDTIWNWAFIDSIEWIVKAPNYDIDTTIHIIVSYYREWKDIHKVTVKWYFLKKYHTQTIMVNHNL